MHGERKQSALLSQQTEPQNEEASHVDERVSNSGRAARAEQVRRERAATHVDRFFPGNSYDRPFKLTSARFATDPVLSEVAAGGRSLYLGDSGLAVTKIQQALIELGMSLSVTGTFDEATLAAIEQYEADSLPGRERYGRTGLTASILKQIDYAFAGRGPYLSNATRDPESPGAGTRELTRAENDAVAAVLSPVSDAGPAASFREMVDGKQYGDRMRDELSRRIDELHEKLYASKAPLRSEPKKNLFDWNVFESTAAAAKNVTDALYGSFATGPALSASTGTLVDQWEAEEHRQAQLSADERRAQAGTTLWYLVNASCTQINREHNAYPAAETESAIIRGVIESILDRPGEIERLNQIDIGWTGTKHGGKVGMQRFKPEDARARRVELWSQFQVFIHEYLHILAHEDFLAYALEKSSSEYHLLAEGFCEFFTSNVLESIQPTKELRQQVEGPYFDPDSSGMPAVGYPGYASRAQAEEIAGIVGTQNMQHAYFLGEVELIDGTAKRTKR